MKFNTYIPKDNFKNLKNTKIKEYDGKYLDIEKEIEKSYTDKCKDDNEQYVSIEDIHRLINGMYLSDDSKKN